MPRHSLSIALGLGAAYFLAVALAHSLGVQVPGAYLFFDIPSTAFQDRIIGLLAFGWSLYFADTAWRCRRAPDTSIAAILIAGAVALLALARIVVGIDFTQYTPQPKLAAYWGQIGALAVYLVVLLVLSRRPDRRPTPDAPSRPGAPG